MARSQENQQAGKPSRSNAAYGCIGFVAIFLVILGYNLVKGEKTPNKPCLPVSSDIATLISLGLDQGLTLRAISAIEAEGYSNGFLVGAEIQGAGIMGDDQIGEWLVIGSISNANLVSDIRSIKGYANTYSTFDNLGFIDSIDAGGNDAFSCVRERL